MRRLCPELSGSGHIRLPRSGLRRLHHTEMDQGAGKSLLRAELLLTPESGQKAIFRGGLKNHFNTGPIPRPRAHMMQPHNTIRVDQYIPAPLPNISV